jgi:hypothetical protein
MHPQGGGEGGGFYLASASFFSFSFSSADFSLFVSNTNIKGSSYDLHLRINTSRAVDASFKREVGISLKIPKF